MCMTIKYQVRSSSLLTKGTSPNLALETASVLLFCCFVVLCLFCIRDFEISYREFDILVGSFLKNLLSVKIQIAFNSCLKGVLLVFKKFNSEYCMTS